MKTSPRKKKAPAPRRVSVFREQRIESWEQLVRELESHANWAFRGQRDARWGLRSTIERRFEAARVDQRAWPEQESRVLRIFKRKAHLYLDHIPEADDLFRWLAMMQHHGAPTRLIDFTWSFYVAAFFALEHASRDAAIFAVNPAELIKPRRLRMGSRMRMVKPEDLGPWEKGNYEKHFLPNKHRFVLYGEPYIMNQRLMAQSGTFIIPATIHDPVEAILADYPNAKDVVVKFVLATDRLRDTAMRKLYGMNITYFTLFPGLDGLGRSMGFESEYNWAFDPRRPGPR